MGDTAISRRRGAPGAWKKIDKIADDSEQVGEGGDRNVRSRGSTSKVENID